jgi:hypothetical protein
MQGELAGEKATAVHSITPCRCPHALLATTTPKRTTEKLAEKRPRRYWIEINRVLFLFSKHIRS